RPATRLRGLKEPAFLPRPVARDVAGPGHERREEAERDVRDGLEDLLIAPARLARLLVEVHRGRAVDLDQRLDIAQQHRFALVARVELARQGDLVEPDPRVARGALELCQPVLASLVL